MHATLAGIRPAATGFSAIHIQPMLADLPHLAVTTPHPQGTIHFLLEKQANRFHGRVITPHGVPCTIRLPQREIRMEGDTAEFTLDANTRP
jgi:hypothetical protein